MANRFKSRTIYTVLLLSCIVVFWLFDNFFTPDTYSLPKEEIVYNSFPKELLPTSLTHEIVEHSFYTLSYNEPFEQAEWVAYVLDPSHLTYEDRKRPYFIEDPYVSTKSADWRNYKGSGYDRGHLVPAGDRRFSEQAYNETFYTSNISPQNREFNAGIWNDLEQQTRRWAKKYGRLYVFTGGILTKGLQEIGEEDVDVPDYFYKIIVRKTDAELNAIAFVIPNSPQTKPLPKFVTSIDDIESKTGLDFFYKLSEKEQADFESVKTTSGWKF